MSKIHKDLKKANDLFIRGEYERSISLLSILKQKEPNLSHIFESSISRALNKIKPEEEFLEVKFEDKASLRISQDCARSDAGLISKQSGSTPGFKILKFPEYVNKIPYKICLDEVSSSSDLVLFALDSAGKILFKKKIKGSLISVNHVIALEPMNIEELYLTFAKPVVGDYMLFSKIKYSIRHDLPRKKKNVIAGMASIPGRNENLQKCINSIIGQVDQLHIYLNGYKSVPSWLLDIDNLIIYKSEDYDDLGDAGKFFAYDLCDCDYYFSVDDDILYPENYVVTLIEYADKFQTPVGVHGSIFSYPYRGYYAPNGRYVHHFKDSNPIAKRVHVLGTGTLCIPKKLIPKIPSFLYPNMADIWFAEYCANKNIPLMCIPRAFKWLHPLDDGTASIYESNVDLITVQKEILERKCDDFKNAVITVKSDLPKVLIGIKTFNRIDYVKDCLDSLLKTIITESYDIVIAVADDGSTDETLSYLKSLKIPYEFHLIENNRKYAPGQLNSLLDLANKINFDFMVVVDDDVIFKKHGWLDLYYKAAQNSGYHHLCHFNLPHFAQLATKRKEDLNPNPMIHGEYDLVAYKDVYSCMGALFTITPNILNIVGWADEVNFFVRGGWHIDYSARCCRAGFNEKSRFFDIANSNDYLELQNTIAVEYKTAIAWESDDFKRASTKEERLRRNKLIHDNSRIYISKEDSVKGKLVNDVPIRHVNLNDIFRDVYVINLDRRDDRIAKMGKFLSHLNIKYKRYSAVDGKDLSVKKEYIEYSNRDRFIDKDNLLSSKEFFLGDLSDARRAKHIEAQVNGPAIRSVGAWAYLSTYEKILKECWISGRDYFLIFDDDCLFHKNFHQLFNSVISELPQDWKLLQLGTMQYDWNLIRKYSNHLYQPDGVLVASHAVAFHRDLIPIFLKFIEYRTIPFDMGPLHYAARLFKEKSFVAIPNLVIQDNSESDIQSSDVAGSTSNLSENNVYGWIYSDYLSLNDIN